MQVLCTFVLRCSIASTDAVLLEISCCNAKLAHMQSSKGIGNLPATAVRSRVQQQIKTKKTMRSSLNVIFSCCHYQTVPVIAFTGSKSKLHRFSLKGSPVVFAIENSRLCLVQA